MARKNPHDALYMLHWYDVKVFPPLSASTNAVEIILNSLIGALNNRPKLPDTIVIMFGDVQFWCDDQALKFTMDSLIKTLLKEIRRIIQARLRDLPAKAQSGEPHLYFVKLNWKPEKAVDSVSGYPKKRRTFNKLLDTIVRPRGVNTILLHEVNDRLDTGLFLAHGELSEKGYRQVWASLSGALQDFHELGHQAKKVYTVMAKNTAHPQFKTTLYSSDDDSITNMPDNTMDKQSWTGRQHWIQQTRQHNHKANWSKPRPKFNNQYFF